MQRRCADGVESETRLVQGQWHALKEDGGILCVFLCGGGGEPLSNKARCKNIYKIVQSGAIDGWRHFLSSKSRVGTTFGLPDLTALFFNIALKSVRQTAMDSLDIYIHVQSKIHKPLLLTPQRLTWSTTEDNKCTNSTGVKILEKTQNVMEKSWKVLYVTIWSSQPGEPQQRKHVRYVYVCHWWLL